MVSTLKCDGKICVCVCFSLRVCLLTQMWVVCGRLWTNIMWPSSTQLRLPSGCWWSTAASRCRSESPSSAACYSLFFLILGCFHAVKDSNVSFQNHVEHSQWDLKEANRTLSVFLVQRQSFLSFLLSLCRYKRESLKVLGTVGEPINPEAWQWYYTVVGEKRCPIVDTFWQTETVSQHSLRDPLRSFQLLMLISVQVGDYF